MKLPTIYSNGTSAECLLSGYSAARIAVLDAITAIERIEFNARDYYVAGPDAWKAAQAEHVARLGQLSAIAGDLQIIELHVMDMIDAKARQLASRPL